MVVGGAVTFVAMSKWLGLVSSVTACSRLWVVVPLPSLASVWLVGVWALAIAKLAK